MEGSQPNGKPENRVDYLERCPECKGRILEDRERAERYCEECGAVYDSNMPGVGSGRNEFDEEGRPSQSSGPAPTHRLHDKGLSTDISYSGKGVKADVARRLRRTHWQTITQGDKTLIYALQCLDTYGTRLDLSEEFREETAYYLKRARDLSLIRGRSFDDVITSLYYLVCIEREVPRSLSFVAKKCSRDRRTIGKTEKMIKREIDELRDLPIPDYEDYLPWLCTDLKMSMGTRVMAKEVLKDMRELNIGGGRNPVAVAATAAYISGILNKEWRSQREVCNVSDITEVTVRNIVKLYEEKKGVKVNKE